MKNRQKITRVPLNVDLTEDYTLLGIVSAEPDYKLSLLINKKLKISLKYNDPVEEINDSGSTIVYSRFSDYNGSSEIAYNLICNKSGNEILIKKLKKIDYLLQVYSSYFDIDMEWLAGSLRAIDSITAVFVLDPFQIRDKKMHYLIS
jgi:hypothetical protein